MSKSPKIFCSLESSSRQSVLLPPSRAIIDVVFDISPSTPIPLFGLSIPCESLGDRRSLDGDDYRQGPIRKDTKMDVETAEKVYQVVMKQNHVMGFDDERVRDFVFKMLNAQDRRLTRSEVMQMETPSEGDVIELIEEYRSDEERINELEAKFEPLCNELDEVVLREVYGLNESSEEIVDEFLEVW